MSVFIIAEAGVNHNGDFVTAQRLIDVAVFAGADAVKFQTFKAEQLVTAQASTAAYQAAAGSGDKQLTMLKALELPYAWHIDLQAYCQSQGIQFLSTAFDFDSLAFLLELGVSRLKIPSGEITNGPLLLAHAHTGKPILLSTGMATLGEIETALGVLAFGYLHTEPVPTLRALQQAYASDAGQQLLREKVTLLHCTSEYPTPAAHIHLRTLDALHHAFGLVVGYSDHSIGSAIPIAAAACGAQVIEKHFTLDKSQSGPDHLVSLEPEELKVMVEGIRLVEKALGQGLKVPQTGEIDNARVVRKSLVARKTIAAGELFTPDNIAIKRPGTGKNPMLYWELLNQPSPCDYAADELL